MYQHKEPKVQNNGQPQTVAMDISILNAQYTIEEIYREDVNTYSGHREAGESSKISNMLDPW